MFFFFIIISGSICCLYSPSKKHSKGAFKSCEWIACIYLNKQDWASCHWPSPFHFWLATCYFSVSSHCSLVTWTVTVCFVQTVFRTAHLSFLLVSLQCSADTCPEAVKRLSQRTLPLAGCSVSPRLSSSGYSCIRRLSQDTPGRGRTIPVVWEERGCRDGWHLHSVPWRQCGSCPPLVGQHRKWPKPGVSMNLVRAVIR